MGAKVVGIDLEFQETRGPNDLIADLRILEDGEQIINSVISEHGRIDGLVNNAGISKSFSPSKYDINSFLEVFSVNLNSAILLSIEACKVMSKQPTGGSIVNITSLGAHLGFPQNPAYQISKAGLAALTRSLAKDWGKYGVRANNIVPGYFRTAMTEDSFQDPNKRKARETMSFLNRWGNSEELVGPVAFLISEMSSFVTGSDLFVDGGWSANGGI
jgi:NAD(P)-dependent dehydrogenase (short-subunit alcohol dehydrogenase family)